MFFPSKHIFGSYLTPKRTPSRHYSTRTAGQNSEGMGVCDSGLAPRVVIASKVKPFGPELTAEGQSRNCPDIREIATALCASQ